MSTLQRELPTTSKTNINTTKTRTKIFIMRHMRICTNLDAVSFLAMRCCAAAQLVPWLPPSKL